jgi:hypothetical protein
LLESHLIVTGGTYSRLGSFQSMSVGVNAMQAAVRTNESGGDQRNFADAAANFQDAHPAGNSGAAQKTVSQWVENRSLECQPPSFVVGAIRCRSGVRAGAHRFPHIGSVGNYMPAQ